MLIDRRLIARFDWGLCLLALLIPLIGLLVLYSAGYDPDTSLRFFNWLDLEIHSRVFTKQLAFVGLGIVAMLVAISLNPQFLNRYAYLIYGICVVLLLAVLLFGVVSHGSRRWLDIGSFNFQPSEIMKLALIIGLARYLSRRPPERGVYGFKQIIIPFMFFCLPMGLVMRQPDLGTALSIGVIGFSMVLFMGIRLKSLLLMILALGMSLVPIWYSLHDYQQRRVMVLLYPDQQDVQGSGYHINQSKIAVGSGKFFGKGFLKGTQTQLEFLPERTTDFVFCVLAEEGGFLACIVVLFLYALLIYGMLQVVLKCKDLFCALLVFGISVMIFFHAVVNIGMVVGIFPIVGLPLPLFSYGGSALISTLFAVGIVLGINVRRLAFVSGS